MATGTMELNCKTCLNYEGANSCNTIESDAISSKTYNVELRTTIPCQQLRPFAEQSHTSRPSLLPSLLELTAGCFESLLSLVAAFHPSEQPTSRILDERITVLILACKRDVRVSKNGGGDQDGRSRWKFNGDLEIPENKVPTLGGVVISERSDGAQPRSQVQVVGVYVSDRLWPEVACCARKHIVLEVTLQVGILVAQGIERVAVQVMELGCK